MKKMGWRSWAFIATLFFTALMLYRMPGDEAYADAPVRNAGWSEEGGKWYYYANGSKKTGWLYDKD